MNEIPIIIGVFVGTIAAFLVLLKAQKDKFKALEAIFLENMKKLVKKMDQIEEKKNKGEK